MNNSMGVMGNYSERNEALLLIMLLMIMSPNMMFGSDTFMIVMCMFLFMPSFSGVC